MKPGVTWTRCTKNYDQKTKFTIANSTLKFSKLVDIQIRQIARAAGVHGDVRAMPIDTFPRGKRYVPEKEYIHMISSYITADWSNIE